MHFMRELWQQSARFLNILTDWILILVGLALIVKAFLAVDVTLARYVIIAIGLLFMGAGFWYRYRRKKKG